MKKPKKKQNSILDERTKKIIFGKDKSNRLFDGLSQGPSLEEYTQNPLTNLEEINERLDTIGELVEDKNLRGKITNISNVFGYDYKSLYESLEAFLGVGDLKDGYSGEKYTRKLRSKIDYLADAIEELPGDFGKTKFKTKNLERLAQEYAGLISGKISHDLGQFFNYITELNEQIKQFEPKQEDGEKIAEAEEKGISYDQLAKLVDEDKFHQFAEVPSLMKPFHQSISPFLSLADEAIRKNYTRPEVVAKQYNCLIIKQGKYDKLSSRDGVKPNDTYLEDGVNVEVLEGVNDGGKTIDMKKSLYISIRALSGSWVPAEYAKVSIRDKIILREKGTGDAISAFQQDGKSTKETNPNKGEYWLIGMDEAFTSTEYVGGEALTYGLCHSVLDQSKSLLIISSHYSELSLSFREDDRVKFVHFPFERKQSKRVENGIEVVFPYEKQDGPLQDYKYAIAVANSQGFDQKTLAYAEQRLAMKEKIK